MSRKRGQAHRQYRVRVRAERRKRIDYDALARAVLEQAAMDARTQPKQQSSDAPSTDPPRYGDAEGDRQ